MIFEWSRNEYFRRGLTDDIGQKLQIFNSVLFWQNRCKKRKKWERKEGSTSEIVKFIYEYKPLIQEEHTIAKTTNRRYI